MPIIGQEDDGETCFAARINDVIGGAAQQKRTIGEDDYIQAAKRVKTNVSVAKNVMYKK